MTEQQAEKKAAKQNGYVFRKGSSWDAPWGWCVKGDKRWQKIKTGALKIDRRTLRKA